MRRALHRGAARYRLGLMTVRRLAILWWILMLVARSSCFGAEPRDEAVSGFNAYVGAVESRLAQEHRSQNAFLDPAALTPRNKVRLRDGELIIERLSPAAGKALPGALLHDWRGTAFIAGAKAEDFLRLLRDFDAYPRHFSPEVLQTRLIAQRNDDFQVLMRVRQKHVITVVLDTTYDVALGKLDGKDGYSTSRSVRISDVGSSDAERALGGVLWRLNTYWSYEERDGGLYIQIESVSLTPSIPHGLGWAIGPYVESIPHESLQFTLRSVCNALRAGE